MTTLINDSSKEGKNVLPGRWMVLCRSQCATNVNQNDLSIMPIPPCVNKPLHITVGKNDFAINNPAAMHRKENLKSATHKNTFENTRDREREREARKKERNKRASKELTFDFQF